MNRSVWLSVVLVTVSGTLGCAGSEPEPTSAAAPQAVTSDDRGRVLAAIQRARSENGLGPVQVLDDAPPLATAAEMIRRGAPPDQAVQVAMQRVVELESSEARAWCIPSDDLDALQLPSVILERAEVTLAVVAVRKAEGSPPPPFVVCIMVLEDGSDFKGGGM